MEAEASTPFMFKSRLYARLKRSLATTVEGAHKPSFFIRFCFVKIPPILDNGLRLAFTVRLGAFRAFL